LLVTNQDATLLNPPVRPQVLKGYLNKYTNVAKGWNTRWFVLKGGVLSCECFFLVFFFFFRWRGEGMLKRRVGAWAVNLVPTACGLAADSAGYRRCRMQEAPSAPCPIGI
jgi:hypothetical protein